MAETIKVQAQGEGTHEAVALRLLHMVNAVERLDDRKAILDAYVECRNAAYGSRPGR